MYSIKKAVLADVATAMALVWEVFLEYEEPEYNTEGIAEFKKTIAVENMRENMQERQYNLWLCLEEGECIGVIASRPPLHISLLFVRKSHHRKGVATALLAHMLQFYEDKVEEEYITVNSSPYAVEAYRHMGFSPTNSERTVHGIRFTPMRRAIRVKE